MYEVRVILESKRKIIDIGLGDHPHKQLVKKRHSNSNMLAIIRFLKHYQNYFTSSVVGESFIEPCGYDARIYGSFTVSLTFCTKKDYKLFKLKNANYLLDLTSKTQTVVVSIYAHSDDIGV